MTRKEDRNMALGLAHEFIVGALRREGEDRNKWCDFYRDGVTIIYQVQNITQLEYQYLLEIINEFNPEKS